MARRAAIPHSLGECAKFLGLPVEKDTEGKRLIKKFSMLQRVTKKQPQARIYPQDDPEDFNKFVDYCVQDVIVEREIHKKLKKFELKGETLEGFLFDAGMNHRGVPVNVNALEIVNDLVDELDEKLVNQFREIVGLNPTQRDKVLTWMRERGFPSKNMQATTVETVLEKTPESIGMDPVAHEALRIKSLVGFAALKKIPTILAAANTDGRVRGALMWSGAIRTHRWAGRIIQPQNFKRPVIKDNMQFYSTLCEGWLTIEEIELMYDNPLLAIASCIRHFIQPHDFTQFLNADYAAIEARIVCWLCGQEDTLEAFRRGEDLYKLMASKIFNKSVEEVDSEDRFVGKQTILGAGYNMGSKKFQSTCAGYGQEIDKPTAELAIKTFRSVNSKISGAWKTIDQAAKDAVACPGKKFHGTDKISFCYSKEPGFPALIMRLPSGHCLIYPQAKLVDTWNVWHEGEMKKFYTQFKADEYLRIKRLDREREDDEGNILPPVEWSRGTEVQFWGNVQGRWCWVSTYGGNLLENACQAVAGDIMTHGILTARDRGFDTFMLVHDECLCEWHEGQTVEDLCDALCELPDWAHGLPLKAEGDLIPFYKK